MSDYIKTPRINSAMLPDYRLQTVRLVGKILKLQGDSAVVEASDGGNVEIMLNRESHFSKTFVEIIGKVSEDGKSVKVLSGTDMGDDLDMAHVERVTQFIHKMRDSADSYVTRADIIRQAPD